jgi:hypothetical protein
MPTCFTTAVTNYLRAGTLAQGTKAEYHATHNNWQHWGNCVPLENLGCKELRELLDWVHTQAVAEEGSNPGRTAIKARAHLRAIIAWALGSGPIDSLPCFPKPKEQRDVAGRHYLTKAELNAIYFATYQKRAPLAFKAILTIPQPSAFHSLVKGQEGQCPC